MPACQNNGSDRESTHTHTHTHGTRTRITKSTESSCNQEGARVSGFVLLHFKARLLSVCESRLDLPNDL